MEGFNTRRHESNPKEKELHDKFVEQMPHNSDAISRIVFGTYYGTAPNDYLNPKEEKIVVSTIQWLGSPIGQNFLRDCGFELKE